jgi:aminomuconate-semialdehyde/2-hydroxymuconate-6-semialdehyde dehydrogenase
MSLIEIQNYIGGQLVPPRSNRWLDNYEPATGQVYSRVPDSDASDIEAAVQAAQQALPAWKNLSSYDRAAVLNRMADLIDRHSEELAQLESRDNGKPVTLARSVEIPRSAQNLRHFAATIIGFQTEAHPSSLALNYTLRQPIGVVGVISPWNLPLYLFTWKIAPALATGNCVIGKPSEVTPMSAFRLAEICSEAGLPAGVLNIVHGSGAVTGNALVEHPRIRGISFTGGTQTGRTVAATAAPEFKKVSLELGGKNPNLIFADANYPQMLETTIRSSFSNQGQICLCGSRILVQRSLYDRFLTDFVQQTKKLVVGDPLSPETQLGAVVSEPHFQKILAAIETARAEGGQILTGGNPVSPPGRCQGGWFIEPTVIANLNNQCQTNQEEIFGPVVTLQSFETDDEAIQLANDTVYGLSASIWTEKLSRAHHLAAEIEAGVIWINGWLIRDLRTPFGGMKQSGVGREGGEEAIRFFTQTKNVCLQLPP